MWPHIIAIGSLVALLVLAVAGCIVRGGKALR